MGQYLIPANTKRSMLIFGLFTSVDLIIIGVGVALSGLLFLIISAETLKDMFVILTPAIIVAFMVMPVPNHRNIWNLTANIYYYLSRRRTYFWKGWCITNGEETDTK